MAAIVWTDVTALAPELSTISSTTQSDVLNFVNSALNVALYDGESGFRTRLARIYMAAHLASMSKLGPAGGPLTGESAAGVLSRSYATLATKSMYGQTAYGQMFLGLLPPAAAGPQVL